MRVLVWLADAGWPDAVDEALAHSPNDAEIVLLHVTPGAAELAAGSRFEGGGLPGADRIAVGRAADEILLGAADRAGNRLVTVLRRTGRPEREVVAAGVGADLLVIARDDGGLSPMVRFVVEHATCPVLLVRRHR
jgi:nucleotide-binding universal stress UspA family protein